MIFKSVFVEPNYNYLAGNLLNRTLGLLKKNCQSTLTVDSTTAAEGNAYRDNVEKLVKSLRNCNIFNIAQSISY